VADSDAQKSARQQELIAIMELVKAKKISQAKAEVMFREWKMKHEGGQAKSFHEQKVITPYHIIFSCASVLLLDLYEMRLGRP